VSANSQIGAKSWAPKIDEWRSGTAPWVLEGANRACAIARTVTFANDGVSDVCGSWTHDETTRGSQSTEPRIFPRRRWRASADLVIAKRGRFVWCLLLTLCGCVVAQSPTATSPASTPPQSNAPPTLVVMSGERQKIDDWVVLNPDCTFAGYVTVRVITPPVHGELTTERGIGYPNYPKANQRYPCNLKQSPMVNVYYKSNPGYVGADVATIETGSPIIALVRTKTYTITVR
jgi:hypothetical protein